MTAVLICLSDYDLWAQKNVHFLCLEPCETDKNVPKFTKKFGPEISLLAPGSPGCQTTENTRYNIYRFLAA